MQQKKIIQNYVRTSCFHFFVLIPAVLIHLHFDLIRSPENSIPNMKHVKNLVYSLHRLDKRNNRQITDSQQAVVTTLREFHMC
jgi:hypothetical protein